MRTPLIIFGKLQIDAEMQNQLNYLVNTQFATPQRGLQQQGQHPLLLPCQTINKEEIAHLSN